MLTYIVKRLSHIITSRIFIWRILIDTALGNLHSINYFVMSLTISPTDM